MSTHGAGHGGDRHGNDNLLALIAEKERELEALISDARAEAAAILAQARAGADATLRQAKDQAAQMARERAQRMAVEAERIQRNAETGAARDVEALRRQVEARRDAAVRVVIDAVVKGTA
jgi:vacuolar-type H+-ATPase subunit H